MRESDKAEMEFEEGGGIDKEKLILPLCSFLLEAFTQADVSIYFSNEICTAEWFPG